MGRLVYQMLARRAMLPSPKLHPPAWRGTLPPDIISQPVSPRPRKKDGSRFTNPREREKIRIARPSAGSTFLSAQPRRKLALDPSFFPQNGQTRWRWIHGAYPTRPSHTKTMKTSVNAQLPSRYSHTKTIQTIINTELRPR